MTSPPRLIERASHYCSCNRQAPHGARAAAALSGAAHTNPGRASLSCWDTRRLFIAAGRFVIVLV